MCALRKVVIRWAVAGGLVSLLLLGCGGRTPWSSYNFNTNGNVNTNANNSNYIPDAGVNGNDSGVSHDGRVPDGSVPCVEDDRWELVPVPINDIALMTWADANGGIPRGRAVRISAWVEVGGCDRLGGVQAQQGGQPRRIVLRAYIWEYQGNGLCPDSLMLAPEVWEFRDLEAGQWRVRDGHPQATPDSRLSFQVRECLDGEDCYCNLWDGIPGSTGESCQFDCMCEWPLVCVNEGMPSPNGAGYCYQTCSVDSDCDLPYQCIWGWEDIAEGICDMSRATCSSDLNCQPGFSCLPGQTNPNQTFCQPTMDGNDVWMECDDDCDCSEGLDCVMSDDTMEYTCQIPCRGNGDCPEWMMCDDLGGWYRNTLYCTGFWDDGGPEE